MQLAGAEGSQTQHQALEAAAELDALISAGIATVDTMERTEIYQQLQALLLEQMPYIYIALSDAAHLREQARAKCRDLWHRWRAHQPARSLAFAIVSA